MEPCNIDHASLQEMEQPSNRTWVAKLSDLSGEMLQVVAPFLFPPLLFPLGFAVLLDSQSLALPYTIVA